MVVFLLAAPSTTLVGVTRQAPSKIQRATPSKFGFREIPQQIQCKRIGSEAFPRWIDWYAHCF
jgi:hypothetical protein